MKTDWHAVIFSALVSGLLASFVTSFVVHALTIRRDARNRKRAFRAFIDSIIHELESIDFTEEAVKAGKPYYLYDWQKNLILVVRTESCKAMQDISSKTEQARMDALLKQFSTMHSKNSKEGNPYTELTFDPQRDRLKAILKDMIHCAS